MDAKGTVVAPGGDIRSTLVRGVDQATAGAHETINTVSEAARPAVDRMATSAHEAVDKVAGVAAHAAEALGVKGDQIKTAEEKLVESAREYMRQHPVATLGVAVAAGFVLSRLLASR
jgi:ElaB/YqjD/DUF883 family membrane-anchored ribosome-binding protein